MHIEQNKGILKSEFNDLRSELATKEFVRAEINEVRSEIAELRVEVKQNALLLKNINWYCCIWTDTI